MKKTTTILLCKYGALVALCLSFFVRCKTTTENNTDLPQLQNFIADSVYLPISEVNRTKGRIREVGHGKFAPNEWIAFVKDYNQILYFYDLTKGTYLDSIPLISYANENPDFEPVGIDSVFLKLNSNRIIRIFGKMKKEWDVSPVTKLIGPRAFIATLSAYPISVFGDTVFCTTSTRDGGEHNGPDTTFINENNDIQLSVGSDAVRHLARFNPNPNYFKVQDYNASSERVHLNGREIVYNLTCSDTLSLHNFANGITKRVKLKTEYFFANTPFDYQKRGSMNYENAYAMANTRMGAGSLYFDSSQHRVYQLMQHKGQYIDDNGEKHDYDEIPKSLFVLDDQLNQLMEIYIPPNTFSSKFYSFITHKGLYFAAHPSKQKYRDKMLFYRIVVP